MTKTGFDQSAAVGTYMSGCGRMLFDPFFQLLLDIVPPFTIRGGAFAFGGHVVRPHEFLQALGTIYFKHRVSTSGKKAHLEYYMKINNSRR